MVYYLDCDRARFALGGAVVDEVANDEPEGCNLNRFCLFILLSESPLRTRRSGKDAHGDEGVESAEPGAHGLDADGGGQHDLVQEDGAERHPHVAHAFLLVISLSLNLQRWNSRNLQENLVFAWQYD